jgi:hypothetical protein
LYFPVSSKNKTERHNITEILLKVALNPINLNLYVLLTHATTGPEDMYSTRPLKNGLLDKSA